MSEANVKARFEASKDALKMIYYVIIGLAITQSLDRVFTNGGTFVWPGLLDRRHLPSLLLLLAFLPTVTRFVHGASIHFDVIHTGSFKALFDFFGFFLQASLFYVMALSIDNAVIFTVLFGAMLVSDAAWLCLLRCVGYINFGDTEKQWIGSDLAMVFVFGFIWWFDSSMVSMAATGVVLAASWIATAADYRMNSGFYFPRSAPPLSSAG